MLQAIRERAQGIVAWVMLILIGVPFGLWGIQNYFDSSKEQPMASVGKRDIFEREVNRVHEQNLANLIGLDQIDEQQLKREALEKLIREEVLVQTAEQKKLVVSDEDIREFIQTMPYFQTEGQFDKEKYKIMLSSQGMSPQEFIPQVRKALILEQFQRGVLDSAFVTRREVATLLHLKNLERDIEYITMQPRKSSSIYSDAAVEDYYKQHVSDFQSPEQVSVEYVAVSLADIAKNISVTDAELQKLYEEQKALYTTDERRRVSHILIPIDGDGLEQEKIALAKAEAIREKLVKGEDFAKLAKENSGDTVSAPKGGDLGIITKGSMEEKFSDAAFALKTGELSAPIKTSFGYHLIKVVQIEPAQVQSFEVVKNELRTNFQRNAAENQFYEQGQKLTQLGFEHPDSLEQAAKALNLKIQEIPLFTRDAGVGLAERDEIRKAAFNADVLNGRNSEPVELDNETAIVLRVKTHEVARAKPLVEAKDAVIVQMRDEETKRETLKLVTGLLVEAQAGKSLSELAKGQKGVSYNKAMQLKRDSTQLPPAIIEAVFASAMSVDGKETVKNVELDDGSQVIFRLLAQREGTGNEDKAKQEESARSLLAKSEGQREFSAWVGQLRQAFDVHVKELPKSEQE